MTQLGVLIGLSVTVLVVSVYCRSDHGDLPPGPYCKRSGCCSDRNDNCANPIVGTLCYCDEFCDRHTQEDCCPDFWTHCRNEEPPAPPEELFQCTHEGRTYTFGFILTKNCNNCTCQTVGGRKEMLCETNTCLMEPEITSTVNEMSNTFGWTATNYTKFWGRTLEEGIRLRLGTLQPQKLVMRMNPVRHIYDPNALPRYFDATEKWHGGIEDIQDQGWCGASWAISTAAVASDRYGIISKGNEQVRLSAQNLISCHSRGQQRCNGGHLDRAWQYFRKFGIVEENCFPYIGNKTSCPIPKTGNLAAARCRPPKNPDRTEKYRVGPAYRLGNETDIMHEIMTSGPVQATIKVYHDFFTYREGIYRHTDLSAAHRTGYHSVRIVGWGEERTVVGLQKYWKVANSWGRDWGERGYFRIVRGTNECEIESFVIGVWPEIKQIKASK